ncbi:MAG: hypothetical protein M3121_03105, partial [Chloroflexota bacterium]|nr:hypothetical protein [Chloroflexota bacterium]
LLPFAPWATLTGRLAETSSSFLPLIACRSASFASVGTASFFPPPTLDLSIAVKQGILGSDRTDNIARCGNAPGVAVLLNPKKSGVRVRLKE